MSRRWILIVSAVLWLVVIEFAALAHANLSRSDPSPNAVLENAPAAVHLWFTEPLEADFSRITLRDAAGNRVETGASVVDSGDALHMFLPLGELADGVYTVAWRALSSTDGHQTQGNFPFTVGPVSAESAGSASGDQPEVVPLSSAFIRGFNLLSLALLVGGTGFLVLVRKPVLPADQPEADRPLRRLIWVGWGLTGLSGLLILLLQVSIATESSLFQAISAPELPALVSTTRFGQLWLARMGLWLAAGAALYGRRLWLALGLGALILLTVSLFSHAVAARDSSLSIAADWLHLLAMALWVGGLAQFIVVIGPLRRAYQAEAPALLGRLVTQFSVFARIAVVILIVTGFYAAWLQVGSVEGLLTTLYGRTLLVKLLLFAPLLMIAAVNLVVTQRALNAGQMIWSRRLRGLVGAEFGLTIGIVGAVGLMTAIAPARSVLAARAAAELPKTEPYFDSFFINAIHVDLQIAPGWVGQNTFTVYLYTHEGAPIEDASLIRLRFDHQGQDLGTSELRPEHTGGGIYEIAGANLSVPGDWRIRATVQRPGQFDTVVDFTPQIGLAPAPRGLAVETWPNRVPVLLLTGALGLGLGGFFLGLWGIGRRREQLRPQALSLALLIIGMAFLVNGVGSMQPATPDLPPLEADAPLKLAVSRTSDLPYLVTADGALLRPAANGRWRRLSLDTLVNDVYADPFGTLWLATPSGLQTYRDGIVQPIDPTPVEVLEESHGYIFALGSEGVTRIPYGALLDLSHLKAISLPGEEAGLGFAMLGDHSHVLQDGGQAFRSLDLGLSWTALEAGQEIGTLWTDTDGNLAAATAEGILRWNYLDQQWQPRLPLPDGLPVTMLRDFGGSLYALAGGRLYRQAGSSWQRVDLPEAEGAHLVAMRFKYPDTFWVLDGAGRRLWSTSDGVNWLLMPVVVG